MFVMLQLRIQIATLSVPAPQEGRTFEARKKESRKNPPAHLHFDLTRQRPLRGFSDSMCWAATGRLGIVARSYSGGSFHPIPDVSLTQNVPSHLPLPVPIRSS